MLPLSATVVPCKKSLLCYQQTTKTNEAYELKIYVELLVFSCWSIGAEVGDGVKRRHQYYTEGARRCVDDLSLKNAERFNIAVSYFVYIVIVHILQIYYFIRIACTLWKNSKHLSDNKLESFQ